MNIKNFFNEGGNFSGGYVFIQVINEKPDLRWLSQGYAVEYVESEAGREVIAFIETGEFILRSRPDSYVQCIGTCNFLAITWEKLLTLARKFPNEVFGLHKAIRAQHLEKIRTYQNDIRTKPVAHRYYELLEKQPWVKKEAEPDDIASYLKISPEQYQKLSLVE